MYLSRHIRHKIPLQYVHWRIDASSSLIIWIVMIDVFMLAKCAAESLLKAFSVKLLLKSFQTSHPLANIWGLCKSYVNINITISLSSYQQWSKSTIDMLSLIMMMVGAKWTHSKGSSLTMPALPLGNELYGFFKIDSGTFLNDWCSSIL